jgi:hypothetical protein
MIERLPLTAEAASLCRTDAVNLPSIPELVTCKDLQGVSKLTCIERNSAVPETPFRPGRSRWESDQPGQVFSLNAAQCGVRPMFQMFVPQAI